MDTRSAFGFQELIAHLVGGVAKAVSERHGESQQQQFERTQAAVHMVMAFMPRDAIEAMIAGHCVMFHEMMVDSVRDTLPGESTPARRAVLGSIVAMDKAFGDNLARLERYQRRWAKGRSDASDAVTAKAMGETDIADRVRRHHAARPTVSEGRQTTSGQSRMPETAAVSPAGATPSTTRAATGLGAAVAEACVDAVPGQGSSKPPPATPRPPATTETSKQTLVMSRGFQNRRMRRANRKSAAASPRLTASAEQPRKVPFAPAHG